MSGAWDTAGVNRDSGGEISRALRPDAGISVLAPS